MAEPKFAAVVAKNAGIKVWDWFARHAVRIERSKAIKLKPHEKSLHVIYSRC